MHHMFFFHLAKGFKIRGRPTVRPSISYVGQVFQMHCLACLIRQSHTFVFVESTISNVRAAFATLTPSWLAVSPCAFTVVPEKLQLQQAKVFACATKAERASTCC